MPLGFQSQYGGNPQYASPGFVLNPGGFYQAQAGAAQANSNTAAARAGAAAAASRASQEAAAAVAASINQSNASRYQADAQQRYMEKRHALLKPYLDRFTASFEGAASGLPGSGGDFGISGDNVISQEALQQQINAMRARGDAATSNRLRELSGRLGSQGFSAQSPLLQQLTAGLQGQNLAGSTASEQALRFDAAKENAQHMFRVQEARQSLMNQLLNTFFGGIGGSLFGSI